MVKQGIMPNRRNCLRYVATASMASLSGCAGLLSKDSDSDMHTDDCQSGAQDLDEEYEFSRAAQLRAKPEATESDNWSKIEFSDCLHGQVQTAVQETHSSGQLEIYELSPDEREAIRESLHANFDITADKFYVSYRQESIQIRIVQKD